MSLADRRITTYVANIVSLSDTPNADGYTGAQLRALFDSRGDNEIKTSINGICNDLLATTDGASGMDQVRGTALAGGTSTTAQGIVEELNDKITAIPSSTATYTNKTLTSPKINDTVPLTATSTELNFMSGATSNVQSQLGTTVKTTGDQTVGGVKRIDSLQLGEDVLLTARSSELNVLDGITSTTAELNVLHGIPATLTATELGYVDGVTSAVQTQINERSAYGIYSGLTVSAQSSPNMTVNCATGTCYLDTGVRYTPTANTALAINASDATNPRIDIVYVSSAGVISYLAGVAAATPVPPATPSGLLIAYINVAASATAIVSANITAAQGFITSILQKGQTNVSVGWTSGSAITTGVYNTNIGYAAGYSITSGIYNTNTGEQSGRLTTTGIHNTNNGVVAGYSITTGSYNTNIGSSSGTAITTGSYNTNVGYYAGRSLITGSNNTNIGREAGYNASQKVDAQNSTAIGYGAYTTADNQIALGNTSVTSLVTAAIPTFTRSATPASSTATGTAGTIEWDASYIYVCTATNTWKRAALATW